MKTYREFMEAKDIPSTAPDGGGKTPFNASGKSRFMQAQNAANANRPVFAGSSSGPYSMRGANPIPTTPAGGAAPGGQQGMSDVTKSTSKRVGDATSTALASSKMKARPKNPSAPSSKNVGGKMKSN